MPLFQRVGLREGGKPLPLAFQYLILMIWRPCDLNLVMISSLASKCQHFKLRGLQFHYIKWLKNRHSNFKVLAFWSQWRYHDQIQITRSSYHKNQILKWNIGILHYKQDKLRKHLQHSVYNSSLQVLRCMIYMIFAWNVRI